MELWAGSVSPSASTQRPSSSSVSSFPWPASPSSPEPKLTVFSSFLPCLVAGCATQTPWPHLPHLFWGCCLNRHEGQSWNSRTSHLEQPRPCSELGRGPKSPRHYPRAAGAQLSPVSWLSRPLVNLTEPSRGLRRCGDRQSNWRSGESEETKCQISSVPTKQAATGDKGGIILDEEVRSWSKKSPLTPVAPTIDK